MLGGRGEEEAGENWERRLPYGTLSAGRGLIFKQLPTQLLVEEFKGRRSLTNENQILLLLPFSLLIS